MATKFDLQRLIRSHSFHVEMLKYGEAKHGVIILVCATTILATVRSESNLVSVGFLLLPFLISISVIAPSLKKIKSKGRSLLYFEDVVAASARFSKMKDITPHDFQGEAEELIEQIAQLAKITQKKMRAFKWSSWTFAIALVLIFAIETSGGSDAI